MRGYDRELVPVRERVGPEAPERCRQAERGVSLAMQDSRLMLRPPFRLQFELRGNAGRNVKQPPVMDRRLLVYRNETYYPCGCSPGTFTWNVTPNLSFTIPYNGLQSVFWSGITTCPPSSSAAKISFALDSSVG